jgi:hypothetical protein
MSKVKKTKKSPAARVQHTQIDRCPHIRDFIATNYHPAYADRIVSIGGSPKGKFYVVYVQIAPKDYAKIRVPTSYRAKQAADAIAAARGQQ